MFTFKIQYILLLLSSLLSSFIVNCFYVCNLIFNGFIFNISTIFYTKWKKIQNTKSQKLTITVFKTKHTMPCIGGNLIQFLSGANFFLLLCLIPYLLPYLFLYLTCSHRSQIHHRSITQIHFNTNYIFLLVCKL